MSDAALRILESDLNSICADPMQSKTYEALLKNKGIKKHIASGLLKPNLSNLSSIMPFTIKGGQLVRSRLTGRQQLKTPMTGLPTTNLQVINNAAPNMATTVASAPQTLLTRPLDTIESLTASLSLTNGIPSHLTQPLLPTGLYHFNRDYELISPNDVNFDTKDIIDPALELVDQEDTREDFLEDIFDILPFRIKALVEVYEEEDIIDIALDEGRPPILNILKKGMLPVFGEIVSSDDIDDILANLGGTGAFGSDNRAIIPNTNHRVSGIRNRDGDFYGFTIRVSRNVQSNASALILDLLRDTTKSILVVGIPGSGKTSFIRGVSRFLSNKQQRNVVIIDTSNEIAGNSNVPKFVGLSRRMMVKQTSLQGQVMMECVQNHTAQDMIIDEIGRPEEVRAAHTVVQRGVRLFASAHGSFLSIIYDQVLQNLIGGLTSVILSDKVASTQNNYRKMASQRREAPVFHVVIELCDTGNFDTVRIIKNPGKAIDMLMSGKSIDIEQRSFHPEGGIKITCQTISLPDL
ncbi:hypothetical protein EDD86DRAFT_62681 [Gorgonomyces haynaldii]|nr:hypothetical protein EDD86DRAFT_62681 [Gorgonomyces haynaldii]